ncbi:MAG: hypothetical protein ACREO5_12705 [Candidatus Binatia bacterium]
MNNEPEIKPSQKQHRRMAFLLGIIGALFMATAGILLTSSKATGVVWTPAMTGVVFIAFAWWAVRK